MSTAKIAIFMDHNLLERIDSLVRKKIFPNRSRAIQEAVKEKIETLDKRRLARECAKLDPISEQALADESIEIPNLAEKLQAIEELNGLISDQSKNKLDEFEKIVNRRITLRERPVVL
jgi:Arc/MetJ-type ribon-helix-helix transcriptional regulator